MSTSRTTTESRPHATHLLAALLDLPVAIESIATKQLQFGSPETFERITTEVSLAGGGVTGTGEDIAYDSSTHQHVPALLNRLELVGSWTLGSLSARLDEDDMKLAGQAGWDDKAAYHRWGIEAAAIDLALRQADTNLAELVGTTFEPLRFCLSMGLGKPAATTAVDAWLQAWPQCEFKLDTSSTWTRELAAAIAGTGAVQVVDFKGMYVGDWADNEADPELYALVAESLPDALLEDARLTDDTRAALGTAGLARLSWDAPIVDEQSIMSLADAPAAMNIKPSRFGSFPRLLAAIEHCQRHDIPMYAGGQFELGVGRTQVQQLASLFFPDGPNDIAPVVYHSAKPGDGLPRSPLAIPADPGYGWTNAS